MPVKVPCLDCGRLTTASRCHTCHRAKRNAGYDSREYRALPKPTGPCQLRRPGCTGMAESKHHIVPQAKGGSHHPSNILPACIACNSGLRDR